jgi:hypothetical protein
VNEAVHASGDRKDESSAGVKIITGTRNNLTALCTCLSSCGC